MLLATICLATTVCTAQHDTALPRSTPEAEKFDAGAVDKFLKAAKDKGMSLHSLMVLRHGNVISEQWFGVYHAGSPHTLYSVSKTFTCMAVGFAVQEGKIKVTDKVISFFPDDLPAEVSPNLAKMEIRHLLTMSTGQAAEPNRGGNWLKSFFAAPIEYEPGTKFLYNSMATHVLSAIVQKVTGQNMIDYLQPRFFAPLGITGAKWDKSPQGIDVGGWGLWVKTEDMAKLGQLLLQKGKWGETQIISREWIEEATSRHIYQNPPKGETEASDSDWEQGYCYQMWRCRHNAFRADGAYGQFIVVMPDQDAVIVVTAHLDDMQGELNLMWEYLLPAFE